MNKNSSSKHILLEVKNLSVGFQGRKVIDDISFAISAGSATAFIGPNGSGKTTLFRALLGLVPFEGTVHWRAGMKIGYVPQRFSIAADMPISVKEFFMLKTRNIKKITEALDVVGLLGEKDHLHHHPILNHRVGHLSGGEIQRIAIAWALIDDPDILLFDEPTAGIDIEGEATIYAYLQDVRKRKNLAVLLISHELNIVQRYASHVICLNGGIVCSGVPESSLTPEVLQKLYGENVGAYKHNRV